MAGTLDLDALSVFVTVARAQSFSAAAKELGIPKSSVSRTITRLEERMKVRLLHRTTRSVALSTAGTALYERVQPLIESLRTSVCELPELEESPSGLLRVTAPVDIGESVLPEIVASFALRHPNVQLDLRLTNRLVDLVAEGFDVAIRITTRPLKDSTLMARKLSASMLRLYAAPAYLARRGTPRAPADLEEHDWVKFNGEAVKLEGPNGAKASVRPRGRIHADDLMFIRGAVRAGAGISLLPALIAEPDVAAGLLVQVLPKWNAPSGNVYIVCPEARHLPKKTTAFRDFVIHALEQRPLV